VIFAAIANSLMDNSAENNFNNDKYNKTKGDKNDEMKWEQPLKPGKRKWWYLWFLHKPKYEEKFMWSSTILVSFTDWWHRFQFLMLTFFCLAIVFYTPILTTFVSWLGIKSQYVILFDFIFLRMCFSLAFEKIYKNLKEFLLKKK